ncbi:ATP-dependent endonuclease [Marinobacterium zhoushanense]|uniref:ATP-dependent endonuclease n=1 Tax=Marinobacterium zhoushanense TaxID=1679163 RepID=A0ABQ1K257_9GAMM|nr:AAA family ATPase [Marinobacterium zhoushanense]GGB82100.1 ATP-dependent endonuclease [Marinobacterium zhoushanense]
MHRQIQLNPDQLEAMKRIEHFLNTPSLDAFVLCGSAGTGKTTLVAMIIELVKSLGMESMLVAPTGRAAQILQGKLNARLSFGRELVTVSTIHSAIYYMANLTVHSAPSTDSLDSFQMDFRLRPNGQSFDLLIVDEASMVSDECSPQQEVHFGSGKLLSDLIEYTQRLYQAGVVSRPIKFLFVGDLAQLPPVCSMPSPALSPVYLDTVFGLQSRRYELTTVMRQGDGSGVLALARSIREEIFHPTGSGVQIPFNGRDISPIDFREAVQLIANNVWQQRSSVAVVYSNAIALQYNFGVREMLRGDPYAPVMPKDCLLVTRNSPSTGLCNGDLVTVNSVMTSTLTEEVRYPDGQRIELRFKELRLQTGSGDGEVKHCLVLENLLFSHDRDYLATVQQALRELVRRRNPYVDPESAEFRELLKTEPYGNALQVRFGYALTCHKAQGGEWGQVIVDSTDIRGSAEERLRWLYTAVTRASSSLLFVPSW